MLNWRDIWILYRRELTGAFRERSIVVNSILLPIFLYPLFLWLAFTGITFVQGLQEGLDARIAVIGLPDEHAEIRDSLAARDGVDLHPVTSAREARDRVERGELDALAEFLPAPEGADALPGNFRVRLVYDRSEQRGRKARDEVEAVVDRYRAAWLEREARRLEVSAAELEGFAVESTNVATEREQGTHILAEMVPLFLIVMVGLGCFVPSIDTTAGERERSTWETLMTVSASRSSVVVAKYLYVATLGTLAGILNVSALLVSVGAVMRPLMAAEGDVLEFQIAFRAVPVMIAGAITLALLFAAAMMILASFARSFKEGQAMVTPVYWLALLPMIFLSDAIEIEQSPALALAPIINIAAMIRSAIGGTVELLFVVQTLLAELALVAAMLWLAREILRFEDFLLGSYDGSFWRFAKERLFRRGTKRAATEGIEG